MVYVAESVSNIGTGDKANAGIQLKYNQVDLRKQKSGVCIFESINNTKVGHKGSPDRLIDGASNDCIREAV